MPRENCRSRSALAGPFSGSTRNRRMGESRGPGPADVGSSERDGRIARKPTTIYNETQRTFCATDIRILQLGAGNDIVTPGQAANIVRRGQGPRGIDRIDSPKIPGEQWHAHLGPGEGSPAVNIDGTWNRSNGLTQSQRTFLRGAGWRV